MDNETTVLPAKNRRSDTEPINILIIEDVEDDALLLVRHLTKNSVAVRHRRVDSPDSLQNALMEQAWDVVLCDHGMTGGFNALAALKMVKARGLDPPFIVVSGTIGEEKAAEVMRKGVHDLILKNNLSRLIPAIERELREAEIRRRERRYRLELEFERDLLHDLMVNIPDSIYFRDLQHRYIRLNEAEANLVNADRVEALINKRVDEVLPPDRAKLRLEEEETLFATGEPLIDRIETVPQKDGTVRWFSATKAPIRDRDGKIVGLVGISRDVTAQKQAESELVTKTRQLEVVLESMDQGIYAVDSEMKCTLINKRLSDLYELPPELTHASVKFEDLARFNAKKGRYGPGDVEDHIKHRVALAKENKPSRYDFDLRNGHVVEVRSNPLPDGGFVRTATDITELKRKESALRESEERFRAILESLPVAVSLKDRSGSYLVANKTLCSWFGVDADGIVGKSVFDLFSEIQAVEIHHGDLAVFLNGRMTVTESRRTFGDGKARDVIVHRCPVRSAAGEIIAVSTISTDITDRKRAENEIRKLSVAFEQAPLGLVITDTEGIIEVVNPEFAKITGYTAEEAIGQNPRILQSGQTSEDTYRNLWKTIKSGQIWRGTVINKRRDGRTYPAEVIISPITAADGTITHFAGIQEDATEKLQQQHLLKQAEKMESLGNLAGGIAHDFNNMLLPILALTKMVLKNLPEDSEHREKLEKVIQAAIRARDLVAKILAFSRQEDAQQKNIGIVAVVRESLGLLRTTLPSTIRLKENLSLGDGQIFADATQIGAVLFNLASNAADAMAGRPGSLEVSLTRAEIGENENCGIKSAKPGAYAKIRITDTGHGMDEATMKRIFEPFFTTKEVGKGTGLGLATAYGIVTKHGGVIDVSSKLDVGTTFDVYLPLVEENAQR